MNTLPALYLRDTNSMVVAAWSHHFSDTDRVFVSQGDIRDLPDGHVDAVVSPANSFGFMTGGIDAVYKGWLGEQVETFVQEAIDGVLESLTDDQ